MKARILLATLAVGMAALSMSQSQGGLPQGGPGGPPRGGQGFRGPGGPGGMDRGLPPIEMLVFRHDVQADIKLTDSERTQLDALRESMRPPGRPGGPGGPGFGGPGGPGGPPQGGPGGPEDQGGQGGPPQGGPGFGGPDRRGGPGGAQRDEHRKKNEAAIKAILTAEQFARLKEISLQLAGAHAILDKNVQEKLGLSDDQKSKLSDLVKAQQQSMRSQFEKMRDGNNGDPQQMRESMDADRKAFDAKLTAVLTSDQASQLTAMGGKPFKSTEEGRPGGPPPPPLGGGGE